MENALAAWRAAQQLLDFSQNNVRKNNSNIKTENTTDEKPEPDQFSEFQEDEEDTVEVDLEGDFDDEEDEEDDEDNIDSIMGEMTVSAPILKRISTGGVAPRKIVRINRPMETEDKAQPDVGTRKPHRFKPGTVALRVIRRYQQSAQPLIETKPFRMLVDEIVDELKTDLTLEPAAVQALQDASEAWLIGLFEDANVAAIFRKSPSMSPRGKLQPVALASATTYYISLDGDDGKLLDKQWKTMGMLRCVGSGDTVYIRGGTYSDGALFGCWREGKDTRSALSLEVDVAVTKFVRDR